MQATLVEPHVVQNRGVMASERASYREQTRPVVAAEILRNLPAESEMLSTVPAAQLFRAEMKNLRDLLHERIKMRCGHANRCFYLPVGRFSGAVSVKLRMIRIGNCLGRALRRARFQQPISQAKPLTRKLISLKLSSVGSSSSTGGVSDRRRTAIEFWHSNRA